MDNLSFYNKLKTVPPEAKKPIGGGRLKGMTDINPMWRIKVITEQFGPCGIGWYYTIEEQWIENGAGVEQKAFCNINFYYKHDGEWSMPIPGTGGADFVAQEKNGPFTSDECFKMALTDALSVALKSLGVAADVYFEKDRTKYTKDEEQSNSKSDSALTENQIKRLFAIARSAGHEPEKVKAAMMTKYKVPALEKLSKTQYEEACAGYESLKKVTK